MAKATIAVVGVVISLVALETACANEFGSGNGPCAQRSGAYVARYTFRSGTCGEAGERLFSIDKQPTIVVPPCRGSISYTPDNCEVTYEETCPNDGAVVGGELAISGKSKWNADGSAGSALESWTIRNPDGTTLCQGAYDVELTRE